MKRLLTSLSFLILATACNSPVAQTPIDHGRTTGNLFGTVTSMTADGPVGVDGATVELSLNTEQAIERSGKRSSARTSELVVVTSATTDQDGRYSFSNVAFGTYAIHVSKDGFSLYDSGNFTFSGDTSMNAELVADNSTDPSQPRRIRR